MLSVAPMTALRRSLSLRDRGVCRLLCVCVAFFGVGCDEGGLTHIDARRDLGVTDAEVADGGADAGGDQGVGEDGGCAPLPLAYVPADTAGPPAESQAACELRVGASEPSEGPMGQRYVVRTIGSVAAPVTLSCGGTGDGTGLYAARSQVFGCGQRLRVVDLARGACVVVEAATSGPHVCAEERAQAAVLDVSPAVTSALLGVSSVALADDRALLVAPVANSNPLGACDHTTTPSAALAGFIGGPCNGDTDCAYTGGVCQLQSEGYPGGHCTRACTTSCPDQPGPNAFTGCAAPDDTLRCYARCDFTLFATGCRPGYGCFTEAAPAVGGRDRDICLPLLCLP
ncbi:MAG: hypothetical protein KC593_11060 [Myxococcales bacterium]|nr:hypothetical protein [Myxococcales bacterium]MCB9627451.1 hypothetical protein [Sandaracinaceae bacterium]